MPGTPAFSWERLNASMKTKFEGADLRVCTAFWLFGKLSAYRGLIEAKLIVDGQAS